MVPALAAGRGLGDVGALGLGIVAVPAMRESLEVDGIHLVDTIIGQQACSTKIGVAKRSYAPKERLI